MATFTAADVPPCFLALARVGYTSLGELHGLTTADFPRLGIREPELIREIWETFEAVRCGQSDTPSERENPKDILKADTRFETQIQGTPQAVGGGGKSGKRTNTTKNPAGGNRGVEGGDERKRNPRFPTVLISGQDEDPLDKNSGIQFECDQRHPAIYQRPQDVTAGIYWINTSRPLAEKILQRNSADSPRWREYVFQRYVDIILRESIYVLGREEPTLTPDDVSRRVDDVTTKIHDHAAQDLDRFLFDESFST